MIETPSPATTGTEKLTRTPHWLVLLVDDEPEVHDVTRMLLASIQFYDLPVELHSVYSAEAARAFLRDHPKTALVLLDVVMETDDAGLHLVQYIRDDLHNGDVQIVLRTGQPGQAPEKEMILNYDINGYFLKTEVTAQKLYSIVIAALRAYQYIQTLKKHRKNVPLKHIQPLAKRTSNELVAQLQTTVAQQSFILNAQPQIEIKTGRISSVAIQMHWQSDIDDNIGSAELLMLAGQAGLSTELGHWLIQQSCALAGDWCGMAVAVPISTTLLRSSNFVKSVKDYLYDAGLPGHRLELELAESTLQQDQCDLIEVIQSLQSLGIGIVIDQFGTGMSSLAQLNQLQPKHLKIKDSLVSNVTTNQDSAAITRAIIALAHTLNISVVATGVESMEQLEFLKWEDCELGQGDFLAIPLPATQMATFIQTHQDQGRTGQV